MSDGFFFRRPRGPFTPAVIDAAIAHAKAEAPIESVGVVWRGVYTPMTNVASDPANRFEIAPEAFAELADVAPIEGVIHSHPGGGPWHPSEADMRGQIETDLPWAIVVVGEDGVGGALACSWGLDNPPLFSADGAPAPRQFCHGVSDCYTIIRDWYAQTVGVRLPDVARGWCWWLDGQNLYLDGFAAAGFELISQDPLRYAELIEPGDVWLRRMPGASVVTHGGVYLGDGLCIEQRPKSLVSRRPIYPTLPFITHLLRYRG